jgi:hypothetical protein
MSMSPWLLVRNDLNIRVQIRHAIFMEPFFASKT